MKETVHLLLNNGEQTAVTTCFFNPSSWKTEAQTAGFIGTKAVKGYSKTYFSETGTPVSDTAYSTDLNQMSSNTQYVFDSKNRLISLTHQTFDDNRNPLGKFYYHYGYNHINGPIRSFYSSTKSGHTSEKTFQVYTITKLGDIREIYTYPDTGSTVVKRYARIIRGDKGKYEIQHFDNPKDNLPKMIEYYNKNGQLTQTNLYQANSNQRYQSRVLRYDRQGNCIEETTSTAQSDETRTTIYRYTYDARGNWTLQERVSNGILIAKIEREITYYE